MYGWMHMLCTYIHAHTHTHIHTYRHTHIHLQAYTPKHTYIHTHIHNTQTHTHTYNTYVRTHTHTIYTYIHSLHTFIRAERAMTTKHAMLQSVGDSEILSLHVSHSNLKHHAGQVRFNLHVRISNFFFVLLTKPKKERLYISSSCKIPMETSCLSRNIRSLAFQSTLSGKNGRFQDSGLICNNGRVLVRNSLMMHGVTIGMDVTCV